MIPVLKTGTYSVPTCKLFNLGRIKRLSAQTFAGKNEAADFKWSQVKVAGIPLASGCKTIEVNASRERRRHEGHKDLRDCPFPAPSRTKQVEQNFLPSVACHGVAYSHLQVVNNLLSSTYDTAQVVNPFLTKSIRPISNWYAIGKPLVFVMRLNISCLEIHYSIFTIDHIRIVVELFDADIY